MNVSVLKPVSDVAGKPYRPSNGTEGDCFFGAWCCRCARDLAMSEGRNYDECDDEHVCQLIANSMAFDIDNPRYPKEWVYDRGGLPSCTAFVPKGEPIPLPRCAHTLDMFGQTAT